MPQGLSLSNYKAALFDVDGTLVDSMGVFVNGLGDTYERFINQRPDREALLSLCGIPLRRQLQMFQEIPPSEEQLDEMVLYAISRYAAHQELERNFQESVEALRLCHRAGLRTALVTSKNSVELERFLSRFVATEAIDASVCASDVYQPKPHPESAFLACSRLGVEPAQAMMIGDSVFDIRCARQAGVTPIAVGYGASDQSTLCAESPAAYFETPADLLDWVRQSLLETSCQERRKTI
jgi:pyrophosphatase PpaX